MKIIVIDDEIKDLQYFLNEVFKIKNIEYKFFDDNREDILDYALSSNLDAAFIDINMPSTNGFLLAKELIKINSRLLIVFITGYNYNKNDIEAELLPNFIGFLYKPYSHFDLNNILTIIESTKPIMHVKMFDTFDCFINSNIVEFSSKKSKELFALLLVYNGKTLEMNDAIANLWGDRRLEKSKSLYRDAVWRLRKTLKKYNFNCVIFHRARLILIKDNIQCDYWDYLIKDTNSYNNEFLKNYDWSIEYLAQLDLIKNKRKTNSKN